MDSLWSMPSATTEARSMWGLAQLVGVEPIRNLIAITPEQKGELQEWSRQEPLLADKILAVIKFRERVLLLFDKLVQNETEKERAA